MNAVERVLHYCELPHEGSPSTPDDPPMSWPEQGDVSFVDVDMAYREGLPLVLKGVTFQVRPGEKVKYLYAALIHLVLIYGQGGDCWTHGCR